MAASPLLSPCHIFIYIRVCSGKVKNSEEKRKRKRLFSTRTKTQLKYVISYIVNIYTTCYTHILLTCSTSAHNTTSPNADASLIPTNLLFSHFYDSVPFPIWQPLCYAEWPTKEKRASARSPALSILLHQMYERTSHERPVVSERVTRGCRAKHLIEK